MKLRWIAALAAIALMCVITCFAPAAQAQQDRGAGAPSGTCPGSSGALAYLDTTNHIVYVCSNGVWVNAGALPNPGGGSGGGITGQNMGPVINVTNAAYAGGASSANPDNNAAFTAAFAAANALAFTAASIPGPTSAAVIGEGSVSSTTLPIGLHNGNTIYSFVFDNNGSTFTHTTSPNANTFTKIGSTFTSAGGFRAQVYGTAVGASAEGYQDVIATGAGGFTSIAEIEVPNAASSVLQTGTGVNGSTSPSISVTTTQNGSLVVSACVFFFAGNTTVTSTAGTLILSQPGTASVEGIALWATPGGNSGSVITSSATLSNSANWACQALEVKAGTSLAAPPTVFIPPGFYAYSGGISLTTGGVILCSPGPSTVLYYTGNAHAADLGAVNTISSANLGPFVVDGCTWTGGASMTDGIVFNTYNVIGAVRNAYFHNFGNTTSYAIDANSTGNWDIEIGPQNKFVTDDTIPRNQVRVASTDTFSWARIHDNMFECWQGVGWTSLAQSGGVGCNAQQGGTAITLGSGFSRVYHNNLDFFNPLIWVNCNSGAGACTGTNIESNQMEISNANGTGTATPAIQFGNNSAVDALLIINNTIQMDSTTTDVSVIGPKDGTSTITGMRLNFNRIVNMGNSPLVQENNLASQTSNTSWQNECGPSIGAGVPCKLLHTIGGNISQWDTDYYMQCTMVTGTCTAAFAVTYGKAPSCTATWNGTGALTGIVKAVPGTASVVVTSSVGTDTAVMNINCSSTDAQ